MLLALESVIESSFSTVKIFKAQTTSSALTILADHHVKLIILDLGLPDCPPLQAIKRLSEAQANVPILICTGRDESANALFYLSRGADGFISKDAPKSELVEAIRSILSKKKFVSQKIKDHIYGAKLNGEDPHDNPMELLSDREMQIMELLLIGMGTKQIASQLNVAFSTVSTHKANILEKFQVVSLLELYKKVELYLHA